MSMRPTPAEVIAGVRRVLRDVVEPEVGSEYARTRLREVRAVLAQLDWDDASLQVQLERTRMRALLADAQAWMTEAAGSEPVFEALAGRVEALIDTEATTLAEHNSARATEAGLLVEVSDALAGWTRAHPDDEGARELRRQFAAGLGR
jgi:hypothetical protein